MVCDRLSLCCEWSSPTQERGTMGRQKLGWQCEVSINSSMKKITLLGINILSEVLVFVFLCFLK